jgi:hypothetical protein
MLRRTFQLTVCLGLCWAAGVATAAEPRGAAVMVVLDCSLRMADPLTPGDSGEDASRFAAARSALNATVSSAANNSFALGVICFGHRLAWDEGENPDLVEQDDYLSQTAGFAAISSLLPGNDVEVLRRPLRLTAEDIGFSTPILETLRPWGEAPLNRALVLANRQLTFANSADQGIVLITAGGDQIGKDGGAMTRQHVLESYYKRRAPIHVIAVGAAADANDAGWADLRLLARRSQGSFQPAETKEEVAKAVRLAVSSVAEGGVVPTTPAIPRNAEAVPRPTTASDSHVSREADDAPLGASVEGVVLCYGKPMKRARVTIEGVAVAPATTDSAGEFRFRALPPGKYEVSVSGDSHHRPYSGKSTLIVPERSAEPLFLEFDLR